MKNQEQDRRVQTVCLLILTFIASGAALYLLRPVLVPFVLAVFFVILLKPVIDWQVRHLRLPAAVGLVTTLLLGALVLVVLVVLVASSVHDMADQGEVYGARLGEIEDKISGFLERHGIDADDRFENMLEKLPQLAERGIRAALDGLLSVASQSILVLIFMGFLLAGTVTQTPTGTWGEVQRGVKNYLTVQIATAALTAGLVYAVLALCGVPLALVWGLLTFVLNFIPNVGSIVANLLPIPVILLSPEVSAPAVAIVVPIIIQFVVGNVVQPKMMGRSLDLHPVTILLALIFWGMLWGFVGMVLSIPLTLTLRILLEQSDVTRPIAEVMAGRMKPGADAEEAPRPSEA